MVAERRAARSCAGGAAAQIAALEIGLKAEDQRAGLEIVADLAAAKATLRLRAPEAIAAAQAIAAIQARVEALPDVLLDIRGGRDVARWRRGMAIKIGGVRRKRRQREHAGEG